MFSFVNKIFVISALIIFIGCPQENEIEGCTDSSACNFDSGASVDDGSCQFELENPIEITFIENEVSGLAGEEIISKIYVRNASCDLIEDLVVRKIFDTPSNPEVTTYFCFNDICFPSSTIVSPNPKTLESFEEDDYFKAYLQTDIPGSYSVDYRFYRENDTSVSTQVSIIYNVN